MKPVVNRLKDRYAGKVEFRIYNVDDPSSEGSRIASEWGIQYLPTFVFANTDGSVAKQQVGEMTEDALVAQLDALK